MTTLVEDETRHAELAWRTLEWGLPKLSLPEQQGLLEGLLNVEFGDLADEARREAYAQQVLPRAQALAQGLVDAV